MLKQIQKVYGFGSGFYVDLRDSQSKKNGWFMFFLYFCGIAAFFASAIFAVFIPENWIITKLQFRIYFTCAIIVLYILLNYLNRIYVVERNNRYDIMMEEWDWLACDAKVTDFWLAKEAKIWGFQYVLYVILQIQYKGRPVKHKIAYSISHLPTYWSQYAVFDMVVKNLYFLYNWLIRGNKSWKAPWDTEVKHAFHKSVPQTIWLGKKAIVYMHNNNVFLPYTDLDVHTILNPRTIWFVFLDYLRKWAITIVNLYIMWLFFSYVFGVLFWLLILLWL